jgi:hypothetical protein
VGDAAGWVEVCARDVERATRAGADSDLDIVKERFGDVLTVVFDDASVGIRDESR